MKSTFPDTDRTAGWRVLPPPAPAGRRAADEPLPPAVLADIAAGFAAATPLWSGAARHDPAGRRPVRLLATGRYEVWVIGWTAGPGSRHGRCRRVVRTRCRSVRCTTWRPWGQGGRPASTSNPCSPP